MKKTYLMIMLALVTTVATFTACKKDKEEVKPTLSASFTTQGNSRPAPSTVVFTNTSSNAVSYLWDFGNGETSTDKDPQFRYTAKGSYEVSLTATDAAGVTKESKRTIKILGNINKVEITYVLIPKEAIVYTDGTMWNFCNIYFKIFNSQNSEVFNLGQYWQEVDLNESQYDNGVGFGGTFDNMPLTLQSLSQNYTIKFYDYISGSSSDFITEDSFRANDFIPTDTLMPYPGTFSTTDKGIAFNINWLE